MRAGHGRVRRVEVESPTSRKVATAMHNQAAAHLRLGQTSRAAALLRDVVQQFPTMPAPVQANSKLQAFEGER